MRFTLEVDLLQSLPSVSQHERAMLLDCFSSYAVFDMQEVAEFRSGRANNMSGCAFRLLVMHRENQYEDELIHCAWRLEGRSLFWHPLHPDAFDPHIKLDCPFKNKGAEGNCRRVIDVATCILREVGAKSLVVYGDENGEYVAAYPYVWIEYQHDVWDFVVNAFVLRNFYRAERPYDEAGKVIRTLGRLSVTTISEAEILDFFSATRRKMSSEELRHLLSVSASVFYEDVKGLGVVKGESGFNPEQHDIYNPRCSLFANSVWRLAGWQAEK